jgi:hypothetical protein
MTAGRAEPVRRVVAVRRGRAGGRLAGAVRGGVVNSPAGAVGVGIERIRVRRTAVSDGGVGGLGQPAEVVVDVGVGACVVGGAGVGVGAGLAVNAG